MIQYWTIERKTAATRWRFLLRGTEQVTGLYYQECCRTRNGNDYRLLNPDGVVSATTDLAFHLKLRRLATLWQSERKARASP